MSETKQPKVSVLMITYNHEKYIEQAVHSVMMQVTDFDYELVIGEDCSTDRTREIVLRLKEAYGDRIQLILHESNIGMAANFVKVYERTTGGYVAILEGDDYWIDCAKLQVQADYLDNHPSCRLCAHSAQVCDELGREVRVQDWDVPPAGLSDFINLLQKRSDFVVTGSVMFRRPEAKLPNEFTKLRASVDWALFVWLLSNGGCYYHLPGVRSVYRLHALGVTSILRVSARDHQQLRALVRHYSYAAQDAELVSTILPDHAALEIKKRAISLYAISARIAFLVDRAIFDDIYRRLCERSLNMRFIPENPRHLAWTSRVFGYPRAEQIAYWYRKLKDILRTTQINLLVTLSL